MDNQVIDAQQTVDRWVNRRRMAWISLVSAMLYPLLVLVTDSTQLKDIATPFYMFVSAVVGAYIGFATVDDKWRNNYNETPPPRIPVRIPNGPQ